MDSLRIRAVRGATTATANDAEAILSATRELLSAICSLNGLTAETVVYLYFTATPDLTAAFPAAAAPLVGLDVPRLDAVEIAVPDAVPRCIRVLAVAYSDLPLQPVYLRDAQRLQRRG